MCKLNVFFNTMVSVYTAEWFNKATTAAALGLSNAAFGCLDSCCSCSIAVNTTAAACQPPHLFVPFLNDCLVDFLALLFLLLQCLDTVREQRLLGFPARQLSAIHLSVAIMHLWLTDPKALLLVL